MESTLVSVSSSYNCLNFRPPSLTAQFTHRIRYGPGYSVRIRSSDEICRSRLQLAASYSTRGGEAKLSAVADGAADAAPLSSDVIVLDVEGMMCEGCVSSVKRILESQVSSASVNLTSKSAIIWPVSEAKVATDWQKDLGEALAKHLTSCGFQSNLRDEGAVDGGIQS